MTKVESVTVGLNYKNPSTRGLEDLGGVLTCWDTSHFRILHWSAPQEGVGVTANNYVQAFHLQIWEII